jgi:hypothetical protein
MSNPKLKVGQVLRCGDNDTRRYIITAINNGWVSIFEGGEIKARYGQVEQDGTPRGWGQFSLIGWHIIKDEPVKVKKGQKYRWISKDVDAEYYGNVYQILNVGDTTSRTSHPTKDMSMRDGFPNRPDYWELVEDTIVQENIMLTNEELLERLEYIHNGCSNEAFIKYGDQFFEDMSQLGYFKHGVLPADRDQNKRLTPLGLQKMEELRKTYPKIGSIWECRGMQYRVVAYDDRSGWQNIKLERKSGDNWMTGHAWTWKDGKFEDWDGKPWIKIEEAKSDPIQLECSPPEETQRSFRSMIKGDAIDAGYRIAAHQLTKRTKGAIVSLMEKRGEGSERIQAMKDLLNSEFGTAFVGMMLGMGLSYAPSISSSSKAQRLATEFRIGGMSVAGNTMMDVMTEHFFPVITGALSDLPQVRIASSAKDEALEQENMTDETLTIAAIQQ